MACGETSSAHDGNKHEVNIIVQADIDSGMRPKEDTAAFWKFSKRGIVAATLIGHGDSGDTEGACGVDQLTDPTMCRKRNNLQTVGMLTAYIKCLRTDRAGAPKNRDAQPLAFGCGITHLENTSDDEEQVSGDARKDQRVAAVEHAAMAGNEVTGVLDAHAPLDAALD